LLTNFVVPNSYHDSVFLMSIAAKVKKLPGIREVSCVMGTEENQRILEIAGLLADEGRKAGPNDLLIAAIADSDEACRAAVRAAQEGLMRRASSSAEGPLFSRSLQGALERQPDSNLALISLPGRYAREQAEQALRRGLHVFLFSDNVPVADEIALKKLGRELGLLVMGPDCGTALLSGVAVGFANRVRRGNIGIVAAAGTGLQEVSCLVHNRGGGISHAIGTGGRDLSEAVGGMSMLQGMELLENDPTTRVVVLISKPPAPSIAERILDRARAGRKRYVVGFVGAAGAPDNGNVTFASTLSEAAERAAVLSGVPARGQAEPSGHALPYEASAELTPPPAALETSGCDVDPAVLASRVAPGRRYLRGLYSGGTLCYEAEHLLRSRLQGVRSNISHDPKRLMADPRRSGGHVVIDLGDDEFTVGRPHPMIDFTLRTERLLQESADPECAVILLDVVLGYGAHPDPAGALAPALVEARRLGVAVVASLCGTDLDPQGYAAQKAALESFGVTVCCANADAVRLAAGVAVVAARG